MGYARDSRTFEPAPAVTLKGNWLAEAGFTTGTPVDVRVMPGCLILTAREPAAPPEPEIMHTLKKVCKLSARKQRQVTEFIQVIAQPQKRPPQPGTIEWQELKSQ
ncbi:endoribonuclease SymE [Pantoea coffeiphila]|uniref:endoribonuclease SymE n=1 Tax=Pantoea coffeiphila TaxID=1465635 RepID=UPI001FD0E56B|nr:endoribonuclease SymE [Pantoea coffeiphila]